MGERQTKVIRIPKDVYEEAEKMRKECVKKPRDGSDAFAILAVAGLSAFIGGLVGYALANLQKQQSESQAHNIDMKGGE